MTKINNIQQRNRYNISLNAGINLYLSSIDSDKSRINKFRSLKVQNMFEKAIKSIYKDNYNIILCNVNAVYIMKDKHNNTYCSKKIGNYEPKQLVVCTCNSMVYSDLDSRQEYIKMWFSKQGEYIDKCVLLNSKLGMRKNFPFKKAVNEYNLQKENLVIFNHNKKITKSYFKGDNLKLIKKNLNQITNQKLKKSLENLIFN